VGPTAVPSRNGQPKFVPSGEPAPLVEIGGDRMSISSRSDSPTSPITKSPVVLSSCMRNGFLRPNAATSRAAESAEVANGLSAGVTCARKARPAPAGSVRVSSRRIAPRKPGVCAEHIEASSPSDA
jgi:hypothetical protein